MIKTPNHKIAKAIGIAVIGFLIPYFAGAITTTEGVGTHFEITDSRYFNIILDSSEQIKLRMESVPETVTMIINPFASSTATSTQITFFGFTPSTTYYKYEDSYHNLTEFMTDENGTYSFTQDVSKPHLVFIQPQKSTKFINNNATGGDCALIGTWDAPGKTCTLTQNVFETVQIDSDNITLDGNNFALSGSHTGSGIYLNGRSGVTVRNLRIEDFSYGVSAYNSNNNRIENNNFINNDYQGIVLSGSHANTITGNDVSLIIPSTSRHQGFVLYDSHDNFFSDNTITLNARASIRGGHQGILLFDSNNNSFVSNSVADTYQGILLFGSYNNILRENIIQDNQDSGLIIFSPSAGNETHRNSFLGNPTQARVSGGSANAFSLPLPIGGNYWSNFDTPVEGCDDANSDRFCDTSYLFSGGQDNLPWTTQNGWKASTNQPPTILNLSQLKSDALTQISEGSITTESTVSFKATLSDADNDQIKLQVELKEINQPFDSSALLESSLAPSGSDLAITKDFIPEGKYHWRARAVDDTGNASVWQEFGTAGNIDFEVKIPLSYKAANLAKELVNQPYLWGGKGWDYNQSLFADVSAIKTGYHYYNPAIKSVDTGIGVDCSGLVMWSYDRSFDSTKSRLNNFVKVEGADGQYRYNTATTTESALQKGDVMFFDWNGDNFMDHVAMYVGESSGFDVVSASSPTIGIITRSKDSYKQISGFVAFKQVISALPSSVLVTAHSPVDLMVTDPDGFTITPTTIIPSATEYLREIPGVLYYSEMEKGIDGNPIDQVYSYTAKTGDYIIKVLPTTGALPAETYSLDFKVGEQTTILAQDVPLSQISNQGYGIAVSATGTINSFIPVVIDIKPNSYPNSINLGSNGVVPVAIFGSATFDVRKINPITIKLANASVKLKGNSQPIISYSDVNGDGFTDISVNVTTEALQLTANDVKANLEAQLLNGIIIKGSDSIRIVP